MDEFTPEHRRRWDAWVQAGVLSGQRADRTARVVSAALFLVLLIIVATTVWRL
jgi:hypothetical protein